MYTVEQTRKLIQDAAYIHMDDAWLSIESFDDDGFDAIDEDNNEHYRLEYSEFDLSMPDVLLYGLTLLNHYQENQENKMSSLTSYAVNSLSTISLRRSMKYNNGDINYPFAHGWFSTDICGLLRELDLSISQLEKLQQYVEQQENQLE